MSDPRHPAKIVIVVNKGGVSDIWVDKTLHARIFVADYDTESCGDHHPLLGKDMDGEDRMLSEYIPLVDTPTVRNIINKRKERKEVGGSGHEEA